MPQKDASMKLREKHTISWEVRLKNLWQKKTRRCHPRKIRKSYDWPCFPDDMLQKSLGSQVCSICWYFASLGASPKSTPPTPKEKKHFGTVDGQNPTPVEVGSWGFSYIPGGCLGFLPSTVSLSCLLGMVVKGKSPSTIDTLTHDRPGPP